MSINICNYLLVKLFQKAAGASRKFHFPKLVQNVFYKIHYNYMEYLLNPYFTKACKYINKNHLFKGYNNSSVIWMFWWQGTTNMPDIVRRCISSIKRHANGHNVIVLNKNNVTEFASLPKLIYEKVKDKKLDLTHFSDILRFNILDKYGGLWVDSTIYCTDTINNQYFNYLYTTGGYHGTPPKFVKGRWAEFLIGGDKDNNMLKFVDNFLQLYFSNNNLLVNYFLADYALDFSYNHNLGNYRYYVKNIANGSNPSLFMLANLLNKPYNVNVFKYITKDTNMFKLTYKEKFKSGNTFYHKIILKK